MAKADSAGGPSRPASVVLDQDLPALVARLGDDVLRLVDGKLELLKLDAEEQVKHWARQSLALALAGVVVAVGVTLAAVGLAFVLAYLLPPPLDPLLVRAVAFGVTGLVAIVTGGVVLRRLWMRR